MTPEMMLQRANANGVVISITSAGKIKVSGERDRVNCLAPLLREYKKELLRHLQKTTDVQDYPKPFIVNDELRISGNCHPKYKWWGEGQSVLATLAELNASNCIIDKYTWKNSG